MLICNRTIEKCQACRYNETFIPDCRQERRRIQTSGLPLTERKNKIHCED